MFDSLCRGLCYSTNCPAQGKLSSHGPIGTVQPSRLVRSANCVSLTHRWAPISRDVTLKLLLGFLPVLVLGRVLIIYLRKLMADVVIHDSEVIEDV